jgi:hypothetical protein
MLGFAIFTIGYIPQLTQSRIDGRPGQGMTSRLRDGTAFLFLQREFTQSGETRA